MTAIRGRVCPMTSTTATTAAAPSTDHAPQVDGSAYDLIKARLDEQACGGRANSGGRAGDGDDGVLEGTGFSGHGDSSRWADARAGHASLKCGTLEVASKARVEGYAELPARAVAAAGLHARRLLGDDIR